jgi:chorismate mutase
MHVRGIRGAITIENNSTESIIESTKQLLQEIITQNNIKVEDIISCIFTVTRDLDAVHPAVAAREMGWVEVPLMCMNEMIVPGSLEKVVRILLHVNSPKKQNEIKHVYLKNAKILRPDLVKE